MGPAAERHLVALVRVGRAGHLDVRRRPDDDARRSDLRAAALRIETVNVGNRSVPVSEEPVEVTPFGTLLHFKKDIHTEQPKC